MPSSYNSYRRNKESHAPVGPFICKVCDPHIVFDSNEALKQHKITERAKNPEKHIHCKYCFEDFFTPQGEIHHLQLRHPRPQDLTCPGCSDGPFIRIADLARHIERGECPKIDLKGLQDVRDEKANFAQKLIALTNAPLKNHFTDFMPITTKTPTEQYGWDILPDPPAPTVVDGGNLEEFPQLEGLKSEIESIAGSEKASTVASPTSFIPPHLRRPGDSFSSESVAGSEKSTATSTPASRVPPHLRRPGDSSSAVSVAGSEETSITTTPATRVPPHLRRPGEASPAASTTGSIAQQQDPKPIEQPQAPVPAWTTKKNLFPDAPAAQQPSQDQLRAATTLNPNYASWLDVDNPGHPEFSAGRYFCPYTNQFMCPKVRCGKGFKKQDGLIRHLNGPAHADKHYTCPWCHKEFHSLQAVTAHSESASQKCQIRYTDGYRAYLDQLTSGIVDVHVKSHDDGTHKYKTTVAAVKRWGSEEKVADFLEAERKKVDAENAEREKFEQENRQAASFQKGLDERDAEAKKKKTEKTEESRNGSNWW